MLKLAVCVSGGGTNLQAIIDAIDTGTITNAKISVVISNNKDVYALERAKNHGIEGICISPKDYESRAEFNKAFLDKLDSYEVDLVVLAGFLVVIPEEMMYNTYNMGIGMMVCVDPADVDKTMEAIKAAGDTPYVIGKIVDGEKGVTLC